MTGNGQPGMRAIFLAGHTQNKLNSGHVLQAVGYLDHHMK